MPLTLAIDTAGDACAAGLIGNGKVLAQQFQTMPRGHAEALVPMVQKLAGEARVGWPRRLPRPRALPRGASSRGTRRGAQPPAAASLRPPGPPAPLSGRLRPLAARHRVPGPAATARGLPAADGSGRVLPARRRTTQGRPVASRPAATDATRHLVRVRLRVSVRVRVRVSVRVSVRVRVRVRVRVSASVPTGSQVTAMSKAAKRSVGE